MIRLTKRAHDPERDAASYLAGEQSPRARERFEAHLIDCPDCWREVRTGRTGRLLAEKAREIAPARLREDVRATVTLSANPRRRRSLLLASCLCIVAGVIAAWAVVPGLLSRQPEAIAAALESFRSDRISAAAPAERTAPDLSDVGLRLVTTGRSSAADVAVEVFAYRSRQGGRVFLYFSRRPFPVARGASVRARPPRGWEATDDGLVLLCGENPVSYLLVGTDPELLERTERELIQGIV